jgi:hypothetical protein
VRPCMSSADDRGWDKANKEILLASGKGGLRLGRNGMRRYSAAETVGLAMMFLLLYDGSLGLEPDTKDRNGWAERQSRVEVRQACLQPGHKGMELEVILAALLTG